MFSDKDILRFLTGRSSNGLKSKVEKLLSEFPEEQETLDLSKRIWEESDDLAAYREFDVDAEWQAFSELVASDQPATEGTADRPSDDSASQAKTFRIGRWLELAAAACLAAAIFFYIRPDEPAPLWQEVATLDERSDTIRMVDGTIVVLDEYSTLRYPTTLEGMEERRVFLEGTALFDVAENDDLPFTVESYDVGVNVLGTVFNLAGTPSEAEVENVEGRVRFFELANPSNFVDLDPGDKFKFEDGAFFEDIDKPAPIPGDDHTIYYIFEYLINRFDGKIYPAPDMPYEEKSTVRVDLNQGLIGILSQLDSTANIRYRRTICSDCFEILSFRGKRDSN